MELMKQIFLYLLKSVEEGREILEKGGGPFIKGSSEGELIRIIKSWIFIIY